jgi:hypothetical protein
MKLHEVSYPSGKQFQVKGQLHLVPIRDGIYPVVFDDNNRAFVLDQRALIECDGVRVYTPWQNLDGLDPVFAKWLQDHPQWGKVSRRKPKRKRKR